MKRYEVIWDEENDEGVEKLKSALEEVGARDVVEHDESEGVKKVSFMLEEQDVQQLADLSEKETDEFVEQQKLASSEQQHTTPASELSSEMREQHKLPEELAAIVGKTDGCVCEFDVDGFVNEARYSNESMNVRLLDLHIDSLDASPDESDHSDTPVEIADPNANTSAAPSVEPINPSGSSVKPTDPSEVCFDLYEIDIDQSDGVNVEIYKTCYDITDESISSDTSMLLEMSFDKTDGKAWDELVEAIIDALPKFDSDKPTQEFEQEEKPDAHDDLNDKYEECVAPKTKHPEIAMKEAAKYFIVAQQDKPTSANASAEHAVDSTDNKHTADSKHADSKHVDNKGKHNTMTKDKMNVDLLAIEDEEELVEMLRKKIRYAVLDEDFEEISHEIDELEKRHKLPAWLADKFRRKLNKNQSIMSFAMSHDAKCGDRNKCGDDAKCSDNKCVDSSDEFKALKQKVKLVSTDEDLLKFKDEIKQAFADDKITREEFRQLMKMLRVEYDTLAFAALDSKKPWRKAAKKDSVDNTVHVIDLSDASINEVAKLLDSLDENEVKYKFADDVLTINCGKHTFDDLKKAFTLLKDAK